MVQKKDARSLRHLSTKQLAQDDYKGLIEEIQHTSDRTAAIVLASWVERTLEQFVLAALPRNDERTGKKLLERDGPLGSFYAKIHLGFALGLYEEATRDNLDIVRAVRNAFAHSAVQITFETPQAAAEVDKLQLRTDIERPAELPTVMSEHRQKYAEACGHFAIVAHLRSIGARVKILPQGIDAVIPHLGEEGPMKPALQKVSEAFKGLQDLKFESEPPK